MAASATLAKAKRRKAHKTPATLPVREEDVQRQIIKALRALGYEVLCSSRRGVRDAEGVKHYGADGASEGIPDLLVSRKTWRGFWIGIEVKRPGQWKWPAGPKWSCEEQKRLYEDGFTSVVTSLDEALADVKRMGERLATVMVK